MIFENTTNFQQIIEEKRIISKSYFFENFRKATTFEKYAFDFWKGGYFSKKKIEKLIVFKNAECFQENIGKCNKLKKTNCLKAL